MESRQARKERELKHFKKKAKRALKKRNFDADEERDARKAIKQKLEEQENELHEEIKEIEHWDGDYEGDEGDEDY